MARQPRKRGLNEPHDRSLGVLYKKLIRPILFSLDPEQAHGTVSALLRTAARSPLICEMLDAVFSCRDDRLRTLVHGLDLPNPVGLAAGFDKDAEMIVSASALGFGFVEAGTFTPKPQAGHPKPRLVRLPGEEALVNAMGFNNPGGEAAHRRLEQARAVFERHARLRVPIGVNIGKGRETPLEEAGADYLDNFERLYALADYFVLNVSSPNTPHLRRLESPAALQFLLKRVQDRNREIAGRTGAKPKPVFVKISPDLPEETLEELARVLLSLEAGAVATNTASHAVKLPGGETLSGGLSGKPIFEASTRTIRVLTKASRKRLPIIGVGGVRSAASAYAKIRAGAGAVQIYTGWIYEGPGLVKSILKGLVDRLKADGFQHIREAVGADL